MLENSFRPVFSRSAFDKKSPEPLLGHGLLIPLSRYALEPSSHTLYQRMTKHTILFLQDQNQNNVQSQDAVQYGRHSKHKKPPAIAGILAHTTGGAFRI